VTETKYTGSCYIAAVGSENEYGPCRDTIEAIAKREDDEGPYFIRATKGYEGRQTHLNNWYKNTQHAFLLLLDSDMYFPPHTLERLRSTGLPFVSGFYMRRTIRPVVPVWFERGETGKMPFKPMVAIPEKDKVYPIGASGWGCMLLHRDVITAMQPLLKGELEIIEDDMDIYPYDLQRVMSAIQSLDAGIGSMTQGEARQQVAILKEEIRPLRGIKDEIVGSDIRFPFYAQLAGFPLWGDTGVLCEHNTVYPVSFEDWMQQPAYNVRDISIAVNEENHKEIEKIRKATA
jgi:hypothetical protein